MRIAPYVEMSTLYDQTDLNNWPWWQTFPDGRALVSTLCPIHICPSAGTHVSWTDPVTNHTVALCDYPAVGGTNQFVEANGQNGIIYVNSSVEISEITDGTSNTLLIGERPPVGDVLYGWSWAGAGDSPRFGTADVVLGVVERPLTPNATPDFFRPGPPGGKDRDGLHRYHFWSLHPGGANWAFADGSVRFLSYNSGGPEAPAGQPQFKTAVERMATRSGDEVVSE
jgi:prepilin-type processing-associated H-X9-DG protein